jgi:hypothetical protein
LRAAPAHPGALKASSFVAGEWLGLEPCALVSILENVGDSDCRRHQLDSALDQLDVGVVAQAKGVQSFGLGPGDVTGRRVALRVNVRVVPDEGLPVLITGAFDRFANLLSVECDAFRLLSRSHSVATSAPLIVGDVSLHFR